MAELYGEHRTTVLSVCRGLLRDSIEAEDAAQQTFLSAQRALANGSVPRDPAAWLVAIARNECIARARGRMREPLPTADEPRDVAPDAHTVAMRHEQVSHLRAALASLPAQQRDAILLRELRGFTYDEVATSLAVSTSAVESLLFRARRGLRVRLRSAVAALSPLGWLSAAQDVAARILGSGAAAPVAAKAVAVGLGTAVVAGGVVVAPQVIGLGHARHLQLHASHAAQAASGASVAAVTQAFAPSPASAPGGDAASVGSPAIVLAVPKRESGDGERHDGAGTGGTGHEGDRSGGLAERSHEGDGGGVPGGDGSNQTVQQASHEGGDTQQQTQDGQQRTQGGGQATQDGQQTSDQPSSSDGGLFTVVQSPTSQDSGSAPSSGDLLGSSGDTQQSSAPTTDATSTGSDG